VLYFWLCLYKYFCKYIKL